jgi:hypothetical protein
MAFYLNVYKVYGGSHEGYHTATVLSSELIKDDNIGHISKFGCAVIEDAEEMVLHNQSYIGEPIVQFRWWYAETSWVELRVVEYPEKVGAVIEDLKQLTWMR